MPAPETRYAKSGDVNVGAAHAPLRPRVADRAARSLALRAPGLARAGTRALRRRSGA